MLNEEIANVDELVDHCRQVFQYTIKYGMESVNDNEVCNFIIEQRCGSLIGVLKKTSNVPSKFDLMIIKCATDYYKRESTALKTILDLYKNRKLEKTNE